MNILRRLLGGPKPVEETDEFGVRKMSARDLAHQLALGKIVLEHGQNTKQIIDLHPDPERRKHWIERYSENHEQVSKKVSAIEAEMSRRTGGQ